MLIETWLAFVAASIVMLLIPGPTVTLVVGYAPAYGRAPAIAAGVAFGDFTAMTLSLLGLGAALAASAKLFTAIKLIGAAYLVYLGWRLWNAPIDRPPRAAPDPRTPLSTAVHAFTVTALNPKGIVFFVAFVPQFIDRARATRRRPRSWSPPSSPWLSPMRWSMRCSRRAGAGC
jgi:threonine/homoserine/homoserine lactone efflux protein